MPTMIIAVKDMGVTEKTAPVAVVLVSRKSVSVVVIIAVARNV